MNQLRTPNGNIIFNFDSMADVVRFVKPEFFKAQEESFTGEKLATWKDVQERTVVDWETGLMVLNENLEALEKVKLPEIKSHKRKTVWSFTEGEEIDLERMAAGLPFWRKTVREKTSGPTTLSVIIDTSTPYHIDAMDILWRGAAGVALAKLLEDKGYSVALYVINGSKLFMGEPTQVMTSCCLKRHSDPIDSSTLINSVAGWFYRTVTFTILNTICRVTGKQVEYGYGAAYTATQSDLDVLIKDEERVYSAGVFTFNGALSVVQAEVERLAKDDPESEEAA